MLDWTESPYIAAFFAFEKYYEYLNFNLYHQSSYLDDIKGNITIWSLDCWKDLMKEEEFEIVELFRTFGLRLWAQSGLFTKLVSPNFLDILSYLKNRGLAHYLTCYELPKKIVYNVLFDLRQMNITYSRLFPDIHGAALEANISDALFKVSKLQYEEWQKHGIVF